MATIREIQQCQLKMLKTIAEICDRHGIKYYLACGTLLGAVRHQGFIPWDDDVDVFMDYDDVKKFKEICKTELPSDFFYQDVDTESTLPFMFAKIRANNTFMPEHKAEYAKKLPYHQGVWVDIFPLVKVSPDEWTAVEQTNTFFEYHKALTSRIIITKGQRPGLKRRIVSIFLNMHYNRVIKKCRKKIERMQPNESNMYFICSNEYWGYFFKKRLNLQQAIIKKEWLEQKKYQFEDTEFFAFRDPESFLVQEYGADYMTPKKWGHVLDYSAVEVNS